MRRVRRASRSPPPASPYPCLPHFGPPTDRPSASPFARVPTHRTSVRVDDLARRRSPLLTLPSSLSRRRHLNGLSGQDLGVESRSGYRQKLSISVTRLGEESEREISRACACAGRATAAIRRALTNQCGRRTCDSESAARHCGRAVSERRPCAQSQSARLARRRDGAHGSAQALRSRTYPSRSSDDEAEPPPSRRSAPFPPRSSPVCSFSLVPPSPAPSTSARANSTASSHQHHLAPARLDASSLVVVAHPALAAQPWLRSSRAPRPRRPRRPTGRRCPTVHLSTWPPPSRARLCSPVPPLARRGTRT